MIINNKKISQIDFLKLLEDHKRRGYNPVYVYRMNFNEVQIKDTKGNVVNIYELPSELSVSFTVQLKKACADSASPANSLSDMTLSEFMTRFNGAPKGGKIFISSVDHNRFYPELIKEYFTMPFVPVRESNTEKGIRERRLFEFSIKQYKNFGALIDALAVILSKGASSQRKELIQDRLDSIN